MTEWACVIKEVEKESGLTFEENVKHYAQCGHTAHDTAYLLGYKSHSPFFRLLKRKGWRELFANGKPVVVKRDCYSGLDHSGNLNAIKVEFEGVEASLGKHADRLKLPRATVYGRYRKSKNLNYVFSKQKHLVSGPVSKKFKNENNQQI